MRSERIGNDLSIVWSLLSGGQPFNIEGRDVTIYLKSAFGKTEIKDFNLSGNMVLWTFYGKDQKHTGIYSLELVINEGEKGMITTDKCKFVNLVACSCNVGGESEPNIEIETIEIASEIGYVYDDTELRELVAEAVENVEASLAETTAIVDENIGNAMQQLYLTTKTLNTNIANQNTGYQAKFAEFTEGYQAKFAEFTEGYQQEFNTVKEELNETIEGQEQRVFDMVEGQLDGKANESGYYQDLRVGLSDNLPDRKDVLEGAITFRESAGEGNSIEDGTCEVKELCGNSVVWNQMVVDSISFSARFSGTHEGHKYTLATKANVAYSTMLLSNEDAVVGHKYLISINVVENNVPCNLLLNSNTNAASADCLQISKGFVGSRSTIISKTKNIGTQKWNLMFQEGVTEGYTFVFDSLMIVDLTQMFGVGNEPSTIEEFYKRIPVGVDLYAYNAGEIVNVNINGIKSVNDNAWDEQWELGRINSTGQEMTSNSHIRSKNYNRCIMGVTMYITCPKTILIDFYDENKEFISYLGVLNQTFVVPANACYFKISSNSAGDITTYNNDICIRLAHSGYKTDYVPHEEDTMPLDLAKYFPQGMNGINGVSDSLSMNEKVQRFGVVKMKDLNWILTTSSGGYNLIYADFNSIKVAGACACTKYSSAKATSDFGTKLNEKSICVHIERSRFVIKDSSFSTSDSFKEQLTDNDYIYYELAKPIVEEIYPPLNLSYKVWDFGTEEIVTDGASAPLITKAIYGFNATDTIRGNKAKNEIQDERLDTLENEVVRKGTYQPDLSVGVADNLAGQGEATESVISFRKSGGGAIADGTARIERVKGNTLVWNQGFGMGAIYAGTWGNNNLTINGSFTQARQTYDTFNSGSEYAPIISTHKYLVLVQMLSGTIISGGISYVFYGLIGTKKVHITSKDVYYLIGSPNGNSYWFVRDYQSGSEFENVVIRHCAYDLTQMFGVGNEPSTIEEFYKRIPVGVDLYAYNAGEIVNVNINGIKSVNDNAWDEEWELGYYVSSSGAIASATDRIRSVNAIRILPNQQYHFNLVGTEAYAFFYDENMEYISNKNMNVGLFTTPSNAMWMRFYVGRSYGTTYKNDICIRLAHSGYKTDYVPHEEDTMPLDLAKYFPQGMNGINGVSDSLSMNEKVQRFGVVDLGTLNWTKYEVSDGIITFQTSIPSNCKGVADSYQKANMICSKYSIEKWDDLYCGTVLNGIALSPSALRIVDRAYNDIAAIKSALQGVILYYELAEPIVTEFEEDINLNYEVWNGGTEEAIATTPSAPLIADIVYGFNAYGTIKENKDRIAQLEAALAQMQTLMAQMVNKK